MWFRIVVLLRVGVAAFFLLTAAYGIVCYSPFAFDMFIRPQLFPWIGEFVAWHHFWYLAAYVASLATLVSEIDPRTVRSGSRRAAHWLALIYALGAGAVGVWLLLSPFLPLLGNDRRSLLTAVLSFVPLLWLAAIDHLAKPPRQPAHDGSACSPMDLHRLSVCCAASAGYVWAIHLSRARLLEGTDGSGLAWTLTSAWALTLTVTIFAIVFAAFAMVDAIAASASPTRRWMWAYVSSATLIAAGISEFLRRLVFPTIAIEGSAAWAVAAIAGASITAAWSGLALRTPPSPRIAAPTVLEVMLVWTSNRAYAGVGLLVLPVLSSWALGASEQADWMFVIQRVILTAEWVCAFAMVLSLTASDRQRPLPAAAMPVALLIPLAGLFGVPRAGAALTRWTGDDDAYRALAMERYAMSEPAFRLMSTAVVDWPGHDAAYYRYLQTHGAPNTSATIPDVSLAARFSQPADRQPDIFVLVIDSLRRDYLSPYNAGVTFTPHIDAFANKSFVFRNAFTRHGGTALSMPALWAGGFMFRRDPDFKRMNAIEKLLDAEGFRIAINDYTVADLLQTSAVTFLDPGVPSVDTDLCRNLDSLKAYLNGSASDPTPVFGYLAPMNVHLLNTRHAGQPTASDGEYPGFYAPYASRLRRIDACFGAFVSYLEGHPRYDGSIVVLTSDHGDSLGEGRRWGHAYWLFPEDIRVPLIVRLPGEITRTVTTDLERLAFTTDIAPTLYALLGHRVRDLGSLFGSPLFVAADGELTDRRRESFLITSSYAATYGLLRRNGTSLFITDLFERKEFAFDLRYEPIGRPVAIDHELRGLNQRLIREQVAEVSRFYRVKPK